jgi:hypothetical protein
VKIKQVVEGSIEIDWDDEKEKAYQELVALAGKAVQLAATEGTSNGAKKNYHKSAEDPRTIGGGLKAAGEPADFVTTGIPTMDTGELRRAKKNRTKSNPQIVRELRA